MLGALCSITGGQRDLFWFPMFDKIKNKKTKKKTFLNTPEFLEGITDLQNSIQLEFY